MSPRTFYILKFVGIGLNLVLFALVTYHLLWLYSIIPELSFITGLFTTGWMLLVSMYWGLMLWDYIRPNSKWHRKIRSKSFEEFKKILESDDSTPEVTETNIPEKDMARIKKYADVKIVGKSDKIIGRFNGSDIHESITVTTNGMTIELPYISSYVSLKDIPTYNLGERLVIISGEYIAYGKDM
jgi:hypothetical protein